MADVELILKADNSQYVNKVREAQKANQELHVTAEKGQKRQKGLIEDLKDAIDGYQKSMDKAMTTKSIEKYNQKISEAKKELKEYQELGLKSEKQTESLTQSISKWALALGGAAAAFKILKDAIMQTTVGLNLFNTVGAVTKTILNDIVNGTGISIKNIQMAIATQKELNELRLKQYKENRDVARLNREYQEQYGKAIDQTLTKTDRLKAADAALVAHNKSINMQLKNVAEEYNITLERFKSSPNETMVKQLYELQAELENLQAERVSGVKRILSMQSGLRVDIEKEARKELFAGWYEEIEEENKTYAIRKRNQEQFQQLSLQLIEQYDKALIDSAEGVDKLRAQRDYSIKQLDAFRKQLEALGKLTDKQEAMFKKLGEDVQRAFMEGLKEEVPLAETKDVFANFVDSIIKDPELQKDIIPQKDSLTSVWELLGIDPDTERGQSQIDSIKEASETIKDIIDDTYEKRVDDAERRRELLDTQIAETQRALELETELMEEGFANNVTAKQKELDNLKAQRERALADEEKAIKQQQAFDRISQTGSIITSVANILKSFTKLGPLGIGLAAVAIGSLYAIFATAKSKASEVTKLAKGGSGSHTGMITGRSHAEGGESFLSHVEVERGEAFGVLSKSATGKYGKVFHDMVSSFNKDEMPVFMSPSYSVNVDNSGSNSRLDSVNKELQRVNTQLKQSQMYAIGNKRVMKNGRNIRIVG